MTTQLPYGTSQQPHYQYGGLMVPYPELIRTGGAPKPSWGPVVAWTFFFGIFGVISAARRADKAKRAGQTQRPYFVAFGVTLVVSSLFWWVGVGLAFAAYLDIRQGAVAKSVESDLTSRPAEKGVRITAADCKPLNQKGPGGLDTYSCDVTLSNGPSGTVTVVADGDGTVRGVRQN